MNIGYLRFALFLVNGFAWSRLFRAVSAEGVDRHQDNPTVQLTVVSLTQNDNEITKVEYDTEEYYDEHEDDGLSGDYEMEFPRVAFSTKPKNMPMAPYTDRRRDGKKKGLGKKRNPCLKKYKDFCIYGVCNYLRELREPSCICRLGYYGERCHLISLPVSKEADGYNRSVALAAVGGVLSLLCLAVIVVVMLLRYSKKGQNSPGNEDKIKLEVAAHP
ncbi:heparin-binding EGF-like growth factor b [Esox lucius]|uniref:Proheparin-binding EGF-like growth factor n=1 Tax=Esox lucius TaxID=8010 RepID=A0A3P9AJL1_ESOLU|nr:heparin-binding EGF-like growth factor b [Esox lucius]